MRWLGRALLLLASGCGGGLERVSFVTDRLEYAAADRVMLTATNVGSSPVTVDLCAAALEAERGAEVVQEPTDCDGEAVVLAPGARTSARRLLRLFVTTGAPLSLRYSAELTLASGQVEDLFTPVFRVVP